MTIRITAFALISLGTSFAGRLQATDQTTGPTGPSSVKTVTSLKLRDDRRGQEITVKVCHPEAHGPFPVIVFSHGFGASKEAFSSISQHWASHGYVVIHPQHADARAQDESTQIKTARPRLRFGPGGFTALSSPEKLADRVADVIAVLDALDQLEKQLPALQKQLDRQHIGVGGHSFGACVSMLLGGATVEIAGQVRSFADPRVSCVLPISAQGAGEFGLTRQSWDHFTVPALFITGTRDLRPGHGEGWRREPFDGSPAGDKFLLNIEGASHISFGGLPSGDRIRPALGGRRDPFTPLVKTGTQAFWDAYLKNEARAREFLVRDTGFQAYAGQRAKLSSR